MELNKTIGDLWKKKFIRDAFYLYSGRAINLIVGLWSVLIFGIVFDTGQIAVIGLFEMVVELFLSFGFAWSALGLVRFGKEEILQTDRMNHTHCTRLTLTCPLLILSILLILLFEERLMRFLGSQDPALLYYLIADLVFLVWHDHLTHLLTAREQHGRNAFFFLCQSISRLLVLGFFYSGFYPASAELFLKATVGMQFFLVVIRIHHIRPRDTWPMVWVQSNDVQRFFKFVYPQIYGFAGLYVINWVDVYFVRKNCSIDALGAYQFLYSIFIKICSFAILLNTLFLPKVIEWKTQRYEVLIQYLQKAPPAFFLSILSLMVVSIVTYPAVFNYCFDTKYQIAYASFNILLLSIPFYFTTFLLVPVLNSFDRVQYVQRVNITMSALNLLVDYFFVPRYGIMAAAGGTYLAYCTGAILFLHSASKTHRVNYKPIYWFSGCICLWVLISIVR